MDEKCQPRQSQRHVGEFADVRLELWGACTRQVCQQPHSEAVRLHWQRPAHGFYLQEKATVMVHPWGGRAACGKQQEIPMFLSVSLKWFCHVYRSRATTGFIDPCLLHSFLVKNQHTYEERFNRAGLGA